MINFFRRIRKKLAAENKFIMYSRYAIGEIVLVVIGILIALQINDLNEERKERVKAGIYIEKLINDLIQDTSNINNLINRSKINQQNIQAYFTYFDQGNVSISKLIDSINIVQWTFFRYLPINYTFKDMQSSGNSGLLNEDQRRSLMELSNEQDYLQIVIEKIISRVITENNEANKYMDADRSSSNFFEKITLYQDNESKAQGLLHRHNALKHINYLGNMMKYRGERIKKMSKASIILLQEENKTR